jgi:hypothetical protein
MYNSSIKIFQNNDLSFFFDEQAGNRKMSLVSNLAGENQWNVVLGHKFPYEVI